MTMVDEEALEWEEWDGQSPFWHHCLAGSIAGVAEHTLVYPLDTVKTHLQACAQCPHQQGPLSSSPLTSSSNSPTAGTSLSKLSTLKHSPPGMWRTMRYLVSHAHVWNVPVAAQSQSSSGTVFVGGLGRLWRGVHTILVGCIPAHALYFSTYECVKHFFLIQPDHATTATTATTTTTGPHLSYVGGMAAGGAAALSHDVIMGPLDTIKQRLQLGHYTGMREALQQMIQHEGLGSLFRSFPITLLTNIPYGMVMVSTNEVFKEKLMLYRNGGAYHVDNNNNNNNIHGSSTNKPLDLTTCLISSSVAGMTAAATTTPLDRVKTFLQTQQLQPACEQGTCPKLTGPVVTSLRQAVNIIYTTEGMAGFTKGMMPRVMSHTPAVAISWTTYETAKAWLANHPTLFS